jgi:hypothetical protein
MRNSVALAVVAAAGFVSGAFAPPAEAAVKAKPQCEQTSIVQVTNYFANDPSSGIVIVFGSHLGVKQFKDDKGKPMQAAIVDRYAEKSAPIYRARVGDGIKLCLTEVPQRDSGCNPAKDSRGRIYSAYDSRLRATFGGANSNHGCGGA